MNLLSPTDHAEINRLSKAGLAQALRSSELIVRAGVAISLIVTAASGAALYYFSSNIPPITIPIMVVVLLVATSAIRNLCDQPVIVFQTMLDDAPRVKDAFDGKIKQSASIKETEGYISYLVDDRNVHLAIAGYFYDGQSFCIWIYGKKSYLAEVSGYLQKVIEFEHNSGQEI